MFKRNVDIAPRVLRDFLSGDVLPGCRKTSTWSGVEIVPARLLYEPFLIEIADEMRVESGFHKVRSGKARRVSVWYGFR